MKKRFIMSPAIALFCCLASITSHSQDRFVNYLADQPAVVKKQMPGVDYLKKSKKQRNTALILSGTGVALITTGILTMQNSADKGETEAMIVLGGLATTAASIPFFIAAAITKHKAKISMKREAFMITPCRSTNMTYTSISLRFNL